MMVDPCAAAREAVVKATRTLIAASKPLAVLHADIWAQQLENQAHELYQQALAALDECEHEQQKLAEASTKPLKPPK